MTWWVAKVLPSPPPLQFLFFFFIPSFFVELNLFFFLLAEWILLLLLFCHGDLRIECSSFISCMLVGSCFVLVGWRRRQVRKIRFYPILSFIISIFLWDKRPICLTVLLMCIHINASIHFNYLLLFTKKYKEVQQSLLAISSGVKEKNCLYSN